MNETPLSLLVCRDIAARLAGTSQYAVADKQLVGLETAVYAEPLDYTGPHPRGWVYDGVELYPESDQSAEQLSPSTTLLTILTFTYTTPVTLRELGHAWRAAMLKALWGYVDYGVAPLFNYALWPTESHVQDIGQEQPPLVGAVVLFWTLDYGPVVPGD